MKKTAFRNDYTEPKIRIVETQPRHVLCGSRDINDADVNPPVGDEGFE